MRIFTVLLAASLSFGKSKVAPDLPASGSALDVIIQYKTTPTKDELKQLGPYGQIKKQFAHLNAVEAVISGSTIQIVAADPNVKYISPNRSTRSTFDYGEQTVNAGRAWSYGYDGSGVSVAVIDSGVYNHPDLQGKHSSRIIYSQSFVDSVTDDLYGHGTHVAGIIAGNGASSTGKQYSYTFKGVAPNAQIVSLKVLDASGAGTDANLIAAIDQAITLAPSYHIRVAK